MLGNSLTTRVILGLRIRIVEIPSKIPKNGDTHLHFAAKTGQSEIFENIFDIEEIKNPKDHHEWTPLHYAASKGHLEISKLICESYGKSFDSFDRGLTGSQLTALHHAASSGHLEVCRYLVSIMDNKNPKDIYGETPTTYRCI